MSIAQASRVLPELVSLGMMERREVPPSSLFRLVPEHVATRALLVLPNTRRDLMAEIDREPTKIEPPPMSVVAFGSFARGDGTAESDINLVVVRPGGTGENDIAAKLKGGAQVWRDIRSDDQLLHGKPLAQLAEPARTYAHAPPAKTTAESSLCSDRQDLTVPRSSAHSAVPK